MSAARDWLTLVAVVRGQATQRGTLGEELIRLGQMVRLGSICLMWSTVRWIGDLVDPSGGIAQFAARMSGRHILFALGMRVQVEGARNVEGLTRYCIAANHLSYLDWVVLLAALPLQPIFIAKAELTWFPFIGGYLRKHGVLIDRKAGVSAQLAIQRYAAKNHRWPILIFPEGTRSESGRIQRFRRAGLAGLAEQGFVMVPVTIIGTYEALPKGGRRIRRGLPVRLVIGEPVDAKDYPSMGAATGAVERAIRSTYERYRP